MRYLSALALMALFLAALPISVNACMGRTDVITTR